MSYLYERLGHERFQQFCQALILPDYPDLQCFPVGQPDGGRDGLSRAGGDGHGLTVVQVKFKKTDEGASAKWMIDALEGELPKIKRLIERGAERYIMMTNASATAHLDAGSHDLVEKWLKENVAIPADVYWRDELDRRLDNASANLKLSYPALLTGDDALTLIIDARLGPERERIARTLRTFVSEQFRKDEEVKFRQVDLTNSLLDLFVDVPVDLSDLMWGRDSGRLSEDVNAAMYALSRGGGSFEEDAWSVESPPRFWSASVANAADLLLDDAVQRGLPLVVLQGAPGQGKSTIAQYVCQVHRAKYLRRTPFIEQLDERHENAPFRLPFKVDLRDFASYLDGQSFLNAPGPAAGEPRSLEGFLASLISIQSGGRAFSIDDFAEAAASTPILIFLDGLDEVADLRLRKRLIEVVAQAANRLRDDDVDLQMVVTSRPSLFGRTPSLGKSFVRLELAPIRNPTIFAYTDKWMSARHLDEERSAEVRGILKEKLDQPHIRELTRNPMQLAILLNLILSIGHSLPDARTSLYTEYVKLFLTREAEKSEVVRRHRPLIAAIVEHLAWLLQSGAEKDGSAGSIDEEKLRGVVSNFLSRQEQDGAIADEIFTHGIERVWVLVQRVEGLFEFEVQPLREYFAAKYLFSTAPTSNFRHDTFGGDRSERFEAIAANPYWANVTRFYAGFYEAGEIGALSASIRELAASKDLAKRLIARNVGVELLADWIFNLKKFIQNEVVDVAFDELGLALTRIGHGAYESVALPTECGRNRVGGLLAAAITEADARRGSVPLATALAENGGEDFAELFRDWAEVAIGEERTLRLRLALGAGAVVSGREVLALISGDEPAPAAKSRRLRAVCFYQPELMANHPPLRDAVTADILSEGGYGTNSTDPTAVLASLLSPDSYFGQHSPRFKPAPADGAHDAPASATERFNEWYYQTFSAEARMAGRLLLEDMGAVIERAREEFGDCWAIYRLAATNAGMFNLPSRRPDVAKIEDAQTPLFERAYLARAYRGRPSWWTDRIEVEDPDLRLFWLTILLGWAPASHVQANLPTIERLVGELDRRSIERLQESVARAAHYRNFRGGKARASVDGANVQSAAVAFLLWTAFGQEQLASLPPEVRIGGDIERALSAEATLQKWSTFPGWSKVKPRDVDGWLELLRSLRVIPHGRLHLGDVGSMPAAVAAKILGRADVYPGETLRVAYAAIMSRYKPEPVADIARKAGWALG